MVEEHQVTADELRQMRDRLDAYEQQYARPSSRMLDEPEFRNENGDLIETADLMAWSSLWDKYSVLTALPHVEADLAFEADDGLNQARLPKGVELNPGDRITAGQSGFNVLAVVQRVEHGDSGTRWVLFRQVHLLEPGDVGYEVAPAPGKALRSSYGKLRHLADTLDTLDIAAVRADLTEQAELSPDAAPDATDDGLPAGPWGWQQVIPEAPTEWGWKLNTEPAGEALVAADGTWLLSSESGWGRPEFHSPQVKAALAQAWRVAAIPQEPPGQHQPEDEPANCLEAALHELAGAAVSGEGRQATLEHGLRALKALSDQLGRHSHIFHVDLTRQLGPRFWVAGPQAEGLRVGEALYVSDTGEEPGDVAVLECRVSAIGEGGVWVEEQPSPVRGITDYRVLHTIEPQGVRTHLVLVVDDRASVVRLTIVLDRGQTPAEMDALLTGVFDEWVGKLRELTPAQQRRFAAAVDETTDPYMLLEDVRRPELPPDTSPPKGLSGSSF